MAEDETEQPMSEIPPTQPSPAEGGGDVAEAPKPRRTSRARKAEEADEGPLSVPAYDANGERSGRTR